MVNQDRFIRELLQVVNDHKPSPEELRYAFKQVRKTSGLAIPTRGRKLPRWINPAEAYHLLDTATKQFKNPRYRLLIDVLLQTGLRISEAQNLDVRDIDFQQNVLIVREGKGKKDRIVPVGINLLQSIKQHSQAEGIKAGPLFQKQGKKISTRRLQRMVEDVAQAAGLPDVHPHTLRHTYGTYLRSKGIPLQDIQMYLGHSNIKTTEIYAHIALTPEQKEKYLLLFP